jgi:hypothetical protein
MHLRLGLVLFCLVICAVVFGLRNVSMTGPKTSDAASSSSSPQRKLIIPSSKNCHAGKTSTMTNAWHWSPNSQVKIYFLRGNFNEAETAALSQAVHNWNAALKEINSDISFVIAGATEQIVKERHTVTVKRVDELAGRRVAEIRPFYSSQTNALFRAEISVGPTIKNLKALTSMMNHELGHSLGLSDCSGCEKGSTAMANFRGKNKDNKLFQPSQCDKYVVATSYFINNLETTNALLAQNH